MAHALACRVEENACACTQCAWSPTGFPSKVLCKHLLMHTFRYAWFAPHTEDFGWIGPTASLFLPDADPPQLSALGRIYAGYAAPEAVVTNGSAALSAADVAALTQPLTAVDKAGSWLAACGACVSGDSAVESVLTGIDAHCRDCGMLPIKSGQGIVQGAAHGVLKGCVGSTDEDRSTHD